MAKGTIECAKHHYHTITNEMTTGGCVIQLSENLFTYKIAIKNINIAGRSILADR
jgi:hypothetical protein